MNTDKENLVRTASEELLEKGNMDCVAQHFADCYRGHSGSKHVKGHGFIKQFIGLMRKAVPDISIEELHILSETDDKITWSRTLSGTHKADMMGIPASGKKIEWQDMVVSRVENGKIAEEWVVSELAEKMLLAKH